MSAQLVHGTARYVTVLSSRAVLMFEMRVGPSCVMTQHARYVPVACLG